MTKKPSSGEMLHHLGSSSYKNADARGGLINTTKIPEIRHIETITHKLQTKFVSRDRGPSGVSAQVPAHGQDGVSGAAQPSQPVIPEGNVRGREKASKGRRASSSGSNSSSKEREKRELAEAARKDCLRALNKFNVDGNVQGLAEHARNHGIPKDLRRVCTRKALWNIELLLTLCLRKFGQFSLTIILPSSINI